MTTTALIVDTAAPAGPGKLTPCTGQMAQEFGDHPEAAA
jgi:hypothetical protein